MANKKKPKYKGHENEGLHRSEIERARSGAAGTHKDRREKRMRTREAAKRNALGDQGVSLFRTDTEFPRLTDYR